MKEFLVFLSNCITKLSKSSIVRWNLFKTQSQVWELTLGFHMTLIFVIVGCFLCWQNTFMRHSLRSSNPEVTKRKSQVSKIKSIPVSYIKTKALNVRSLSKNANKKWASLKNAFLAFTGFYITGMIFWILHWNLI